MKKFSKYLLLLIFGCNIHQHNSKRPKIYKKGNKNNSNVNSIDNSPLFNLTNKKKMTKKDKNLLSNMAVDARILQNSLLGQKIIKDPKYTTDLTSYFENFYYSATREALTYLLSSSFSIYINYNNLKFIKQEANNKQYYHKDFFNFIKFLNNILKNKNFLTYSDEEIKNTFNSIELEIKNIIRNIDPKKTKDRKFYFLMKALQNILFNIKTSLLNFNISIKDDQLYIEGNKNLFLADLYNSVFVQKNSNAKNVGKIINNGLFSVVLPEGQKISYVKMIKDLDFHPLAIQLIGHLKSWTDDIVNDYDHYKILNDDESYDSLNLTFINNHFDNIINTLKKYCDLNKNVLHNMAKYFIIPLGADGKKYIDIVDGKDSMDLREILTPVEMLDDFDSLNIFSEKGYSKIENKDSSKKLSISSFLEDCLFVPQSTNPINIEESFSTPSQQTNLKEFFSE